MSNAGKPVQEYLAATAGTAENEHSDTLRTVSGKELGELRSPADLLTASQAFLFNDSDDPANFTNPVLPYPSTPPTI